MIENMRANFSQQIEKLRRMVIIPFNEESKRKRIQVLDNAKSYTARATVKYKSWRRYELLRTALGVKGVARDVIGVNPIEMFVGFLWSI